MKPVTVVLPVVVNPEMLRDAALTAPPNRPYVLAFTKPVTVTLPVAVKPETFRAAALTVPPKVP